LGVQGFYRTTFGTDPIGYGFLAVLANVSIILRGVAFIIRVTHPLRCPSLRLDIVLALDPLDPITSTTIEMLEDEVSRPPSRRLLVVSEASAHRLGVALTLRGPQVVAPTARRGVLGVGPAVEAVLGGDPGGVDVQAPTPMLQGVGGDGPGQGFTQNVDNLHLNPQ